MSADNDSHAVRKIVLPSGRSIEVVRFQDGESAIRSPLHICPSCASELVQPVTWAESAHERWQLQLECPNCWWTETGVYQREPVESLEDRLDEGLAEILGDLQRLTQANMTEEIDRFADALRVDLILPEDF